jgi:hypothetical protein
MSTKYDNMTLQEMQELYHKKTGAAHKLRLAIDQRQKQEREQIRQSDLALEPSGPVITFSRTLNGRVYRYAAVRTGPRGNRWFTTGSTCPTRGFSWLELLVFIRDGGEAFVEQAPVTAGRVPVRAGGMNIGRSNAERVAERIVDRIVVTSIVGV